MNARHREQRVRQAEEARDLALQNLARARKALDRIAAIAELPLQHDSLRRISRFAEAALVGTKRADPSYVSGEPYDQEGP